MSVSIVTGFTGVRHITPHLDAAVNRGIFGTDCILATGNHLAASMPSINSFVMQDGAVSIQGHIAVSTGETLAVDTCATGSNRIDYVVARFTHNTTTLIDDVEILLIKGTETTSSNPTTPTYNTGNIASGANIVDMPLYRIDLSGSTVTFTQLAIVRGFLTDYENETHTLMQSADSAVGYRARRTDTDAEVSLEIGADGRGHGVWSGTYSKWLAYYDSNGYSRIDGKYIAQNNILWSGGTGGAIMHANQTINLSQRVSEQASGIVLCWSGYDPVKGVTYEHNFVYTFVPRWHVTLHGGTGVSTPMFWGGSLSHVGNKYVYVADSKIIGNDNNKKYGTINGITYDNRYWVLRAVIGV